jgi:hypothetical protein
MSRPKTRKVKRDATAIEVKSITRAGSTQGKKTEMHPYAEAAVLLAEGLQCAWERDQREAFEVLQEKLHYFTRNDALVGWHDPIDVLIDAMRGQLGDMACTIKKGQYDKRWLGRFDELRTRPYQITI